MHHPCAHLANLELALRAEQKMPECCRVLQLVARSSKQRLHDSLLLSHGLHLECWKLEECGFVIHQNKQSPVVRDALESGVFVEDEFADAYGQLATSLHVEKMKRGLWMLIGLPWSLQRIRGGKSGVWDLFLRDKLIFDKLEAMTDRSPKLEALFKRHLCQKPSVRQFMMAADDPTAGSKEWKADLNAKLDEHASVCCPTQIIEDMFSVQKGFKVLKTSNKSRRPEKSMSLVLSQKVIEGKHRWRTPGCDQPITGKTTKTDDEVWKLPKRSESLKWGEIVSTNAVSPYYSPQG